jgi:hypothetical protein
MIQSCRGHQCSKTMLTGESSFHISTPLGIEPRSLMAGSKGLTHWASETVYEGSEIAGPPQLLFYPIRVVSDSMKDLNLTVSEQYLTVRNTAT